MDNVIGFKGSPKERRENWLAMLIYKSSQDVFKDKSKKIYRTILENDLKNYHNVLERYVA